MKTIINLAMKFTGVSWIWDKIDGYKTYGAAALGIMSGLAGIGQEVAGPLSAHDAAGLLAVLKHAPQDPAWLAILIGLKALGLAHKIDKAAAAGS